jgi:hypothetical protein
MARATSSIIIIDEKRYENIKAMGFDPEYFSTNPEDGWIEVVHKDLIK